MKSLLLWFLWELLSLSLDLAFFSLFLFLCRDTYPLAKSIIKLRHPKTTKVLVVMMVWFVMR